MTMQIERIYASERLSTSHGPQLFYEFVFARVTRGTGDAGSDTVLIRIVDGQGAEAPPPLEIHIKDLREVQERFNEFVERVRKKLDPNSTSVLRSPSSHALPAVGGDPAPMGRFSPDAPRRRSGIPGAHTPTPFQISMGPKKGGVPPEGGAIVPRPIMGHGPLALPEPVERPLNETYRIVPYNLSSPPAVELLMKTVEQTAELLLVVARTDLVQKVEDYLEKASQSGGRAIPTSDFVTVVVEREPKRRNPAAMAKTKASLASGLQKMLGLPKAVLWIPPEA